MPVTEDVASDAAAPGLNAPSLAEATPISAPRYSRRLSDKILISFHQACDQADHEVARRLLDLFEFMLTRREIPADINRRRNLESLVAAHERLWQLCHPDEG